MTALIQHTHFVINVTVATSIMCTCWYIVAWKESIAGFFSSLFLLELLQRDDLLCPVRGVSKRTDQLNWFYKLRVVLEAWIRPPFHTKGTGLSSQRRDTVEDDVEHMKHLCTNMLLYYAAMRVSIPFRLLGHSVASIPLLLYTVA